MIKIIFSFFNFTYFFYSTHFMNFLKINQIHIHNNLVLQINYLLHYEITHRRLKLLYLFITQIYLDNFIKINIYC